MQLPIIWLILKELLPWINRKLAILESEQKFIVNLMSIWQITNLPLQFPKTHIAWIISGNNIRVCTIHLLHESEHNWNYSFYLELIDQYIASEEGIAKVSKTEDNMEDDKMMQLTKALSANVPLSKRKEDVRSIFSVCSKGSNVSRSSAAAHENARLQKVLSEKKVEQLKRAKARRLKEAQLKLENQIVEAEDAVELANTKKKLC